MSPAFVPHSGKISIPKWQKWTIMGRDPRIKFLWRYGWTRFSKCSGWPHKKWFFEVNFEVKPFQNDKANQTWSNDCHFALVLFIFFKNDRKSYLGPSTVEKKLSSQIHNNPETLYAPPKSRFLTLKFQKISITRGQKNFFSNWIWVTQRAPSTLSKGFFLFMSL